MEDWLKEDQTIYSDSELEELHTKAKNDSIRQVRPSTPIRSFLASTEFNEISLILSIFQFSPLF